MATKKQQREHEAGIEAANDLRYRIGGKIDAPVTDQMIIVAAWALSSFIGSQDFNVAFCEALGVRWVEQPMGGFCLRRV